MQPKFRQRLNNIKLLALVNASVLNSFGMNRILDFIVADLKKLEEVIIIIFIVVQTIIIVFILGSDISWTVKGSLAVCSADNLGSQQLGGFKIGGSSFRLCRHCLGTETDIQSKVYVTDYCKV